MILITKNRFNIGKIDKKKEDLIKQIKFENSSDTFSFGYEAN